MVTRRDVLEYLEEKINKEVHSELEYELYSSYKWDGWVVFTQVQYEETLEKMVREIYWINKEG